MTLQPLANTTSNMFVYGDGFTYGFILKVDHSTDYDDLVFIRTKVPSFAQPAAEKASVKVPVAKKDLKFTIVVSKNSKIELQGDVFKWNESIKSFYADIYITVKAQKTIPTDSVKIQILSSGQDVTTIKPVFEKDQINQNVKSRTRIFADVNLKQALKLRMQINKEERIFTGVLESIKFQPPKKEIFRSRKFGSTRVELDYRISNCPDQEVSQNKSLLVTNCGS